VYFEVYDPAVDPAQKSSSVVATLAFYRNEAPFQFQMALATLHPGRYTCQANAVDELDRNFAFSRAPAAIVP
jgi:hypothetical protein